MDWVTLDGSVAAAHLPSDLASAYQSWLSANPDKAGRLDELVANTVAEFRDNIRTNPVNVLDPDPAKIPQSCVRHAESIVFFQLAMEMGVDLDTEGTQSMTRADIFLRQIAYQRFTTTSGDESTPSPAYTVPGTPGVLLALLCMLLAWPAEAGWIANPRRASVDTEITATLAPQHYTNTTITLFGHLEGIDKALLDQQGRFVDVTGDTIAGPLTVSNPWLYVTWGPYTNAISYSGFRFNHPGLGNLGYDLSSGGYFWRYTYDVSTGTKTFQGKVWDGGNDGPGSGLDADTLDGLNSTAFTPAVLASNTLWFSTNSYLSTLGSYTALYFVTLSPPSTNRVTP